MLGLGDIVHLMHAEIMTGTINEVEEQGILCSSRSTTLLEATFASHLKVLFTSHWFGGSFHAHI